MPVRLIKVSKNLNVGINTLVEFLHKKGIEIELITTIYDIVYNGVDANTLATFLVTKK